MTTSIQDSPNSAQHEKIRWGGMPSRRTQAIPKQSLFGTALEKYDKDSLKDIEGRYIPEGFIKKQPNRYPLPDHLKASIPGLDTLESSRKELYQQHNALSEAEKSLKSKSEQVLTFRETSERQTSNSSQSKRSSRPNWLTEQDLEHSKDINIVGLNQKGSYNRDKYGRKRQMHNYSLIGDILAPKMDFNAQEQEKEDVFRQRNNNKNIVWGPGRHLPQTEEHISSSQKKQSQSLIDLPPNIRHTFGSRICDNLLSDKNLVSQAVERHRERSGPLRPSKKDNVKALPVDMKGNYSSLGHTTRCNVCPGLSSGHTISRTKAEFNDEVHLKRVPNTDEFRYQRDELSIWVEQDVLRKRMEGNWRSYFEAIPKLTANWDRSAKRPVVLMPKTPNPKPQTKQKSKKPANVDDKPTSQDGDEIVFVTPPLTPPPPPPEDPVVLSKDFKKDEEFWSFYDQPTA